MKLSQQRLQRAFEKKILQNIPKVEITNKNIRYICPFELTLGFVSSTEAGLVNDNINVLDFSTYQRIFTGLENVIARWEGAYNVFKANDTDNFLTKSYTTGRLISGFIPQEQMSTTFTTASVSGDFVAEQTDKVYEVHSYEELQEADLFKFYVIPQLDATKWLFVETATKIYDNNGAFVKTEIRFRDLNNQIAKSGRAVEEFIQRGAAGEGYAWPKIIITGQDQTPTIEVDDVRNRDVPIMSAQIEMSGAAAFGTFYAYGRPVDIDNSNGVISTKFNDKIQAPRLLLGSRIETPIPSPLNTRPSAETDYYVGKVKPTLHETIEDWKKQWEATWDMEQRNKYEGCLKIVEKQAFKDSNPINVGTHDHIMWDDSWQIAVDKELNCSTNKYTNGANLKLDGNYKLVDIFNHNIFGLDAITTLPMSVEQNINWELKNIPIIGGFLEKLTLGIPIGWRDEAIKIKVDDVILAMPASTTDYAAQLLNLQDEDTIGLEVFTDNQATDEATEWSGIKSTGTIYKYQLTDLFETTISGTKYVFSTKDLGQTIPAQDENGKATTGLSGKLYWTNECKAAPRKSYGYVIDTYTFKALAKMNYRLTFFSNELQAWSGTYQSNSKFTGSIRDWTNTIKMSNWNVNDNSQVDYPAIIVAPKPPSINNPKFTIQEFISSFNADDNMSFDDMKNYGIYNRSSNGSPYNITPLQTGEKTYKKTINFDTSLVGGMTAFLTNYEKLNFSIKLSDEIQYVINLNSIQTEWILVNSTQNPQLTDFDITFGETKGSITHSQYIRNNHRHITRYLKEFSIKILKDGNNLQMIYTIIAGFAWDNVATIVNFGLENEKITPLASTNAETTSAIAIPKTI